MEPVTGQVRKRYSRVYFLIPLVFLVLLVVWFVVGYIGHTDFEGSKISFRSEIEGFSVRQNKSEIDNFLDQLQTSERNYVVFDEQDFPSKIKADSVEVVFVSKELSRGIEVVSLDDRRVISSYSSSQSETGRVTLSIFINTNYYASLERSEADRKLSATVLTYLFDIFHYPLSGSFESFEAERATIYQDVLRAEPAIEIVKI